MIKFILIRWKNFLSTGAAWNTVNLNKDATTLIVGLNGHGKSTLLDALTFALFGKPFRDINKPKLVNSINKKNCVVELGFMIGEKTFKIVRGISPAIFEVYIDGVMVDQDAISKDYQKYLEENILKFSYKAFTQIGILGSKSFVPFMRLKGPERRVIIENLLDIEEFTSMNKLAKETLKNIRTDIAVNKTALDTVNEKLALQQAYRDEAKKNTKEQLNKLGLERMAQSEAVDTLETAINDVIKNITVAQNDITILTEGADPKTMESLLIKIQTKLDDKNKQRQFYSSHDNCPTCKQSIEQNFKNTTIDDLDNEISKLGNAALVLNDRLTKIKVLQTKVDGLVRNKNDLQYQRSLANNLASTLINQIEELVNKPDLSVEMEKISTDLNETLEKLTTARAVLVDDQAYYKTAVSLLDDGGIKTQIVKQYLPVINSFINKYLTAMDFSISFELDEEFSETIKSRHRDDFSYESFSEGEKQKIDIALLFAWRAVAKLKNSLNTNLLIMDEIFDSSLDGVGAELILTILSTLPTGTNVFVISHRELTHEQFSTSIKFQKRNNFSEIIEQEI